MQAEKIGTRPSIIVYMAPHTGSSGRLRQLEAGMEEEGVPCFCITAEQERPAQLAYKAAHISPLGVGIGISPDGMCLHYQKLPEGEPLFSIGSQSSEAEWRRFGSNAARLVKGLPFKEEQPQIAGICVDTSGLYERVRDIVLLVLQQSAQGTGR